MAKKTLEERLEDNKKKQDRLKAIERKLLAQQKEKKRKSIIQNKIQRGTELLKYLTNDITDENASVWIDWYTRKRSFMNQNGDVVSMSMADWLDYELSRDCKRRNENDSFEESESFEPYFDGTGWD